ncbi:Hypothetical predicted protein [Mytilus galloprovincialis]|uniref:Uncharacterized protein n=1 Tax=Mytilus galloprovincialis TaxID=29158 RepID=A0A8B6G4W6_MYTGA|nr:Hypothetical predicted protein [Mytilus galloprovincialis]
MNAKSLVINSETFEVNREYIVYVRVSSSQFTSDGRAAMAFVTNQAPYGGKCIADPVIGFHTVACFIDSFETLWGDGDLADLLVDSGLYAACTVEQMLSGK